MMSGAGAAWKLFLLIGRISKCDTAGQQPHRLDTSAPDFQ
jgi:hypothetical protein